MEKDHMSTLQSGEFGPHTEHRQDMKQTFCYSLLLYDGHGQRKRGRKGKWDKNSGGKCSSELRCRSVARAEAVAE
jgi:hypothetical protein